MQDANSSAGEGVTCYEHPLYACPKVPLPSSCHFTDKERELERGHAGTQTQGCLAQSVWSRPPGRLLPKLDTKTGNRLK